MVDSIVTERQQEGDKLGFIRVSANLAIDFRNQLSSGEISREMDMETILAHVAESFGLPVSCHPDEPPSTLYSGPWDGRTVNIAGGPSNGPTFVCGSFDLQNAYAELVWAFNLNKYTAWRKSP
jgi:hypothetical protein